MSKKLEKLIEALDGEDAELTTAVNRVREIPTNIPGTPHLAQGVEQVLTWLEGQLTSLNHVSLIANVILRREEE